MVTTEALRRTQRALSNAHPDRCFEALAALGWDEGDATVVWNPALRDLGQFHLGAYPTGASVARQSTNGKEDGAWWKAPFYGDYRWCVEFDHGKIRYCDLLSSEECIVAQGDLSAELLDGLTPEHFIRRGSFSPIGVPRHALPGHPGQRAAQYFCSRMKSWLHDYLSLGTANEPAAKEHFTRIISAFILLRTIEDVERLSWLDRGALLRAARGKRGSIGILLKRAAHELNSRVLHGVAEILPAPDRVRNLIEAFYGEALDFSALEADPVGQFYQDVLGTQYELTQKQQASLFGENLNVVPNRTIRKKRGAYFTPREYADLLARKLVLPAARAARTEEELPIVLDLAAGSGQLLCAALRQIFSLPRWRRPEVALCVLDRCIWAVDDDHNASLLAALNVLRTTVQHVPEILGSELKFPPLERNFVSEDALQQSTIERLPEADVVLLNPPFHGAKSWRLPDGAIPELKVLERRAHSAFAFCVAALKRLRPGGGLGVLMPAQPIRGPQNRAAREIVARDLFVETVVLNGAAEAFEREQSYVSVILGHKTFGDLRPRTQVISVAGEKGADIGALVAGAWGTSSPAKSILITLSDEHAWDWTGEEPQSVGAHVSATQKVKISGRESVPRVPLRELLNAEIHQPVSCAPEPWKRDLFLFEVVRPGVVVHRMTRKEVRGISPSLKPAAIPNYMMDVPPLCEPRSGKLGKLRVFLPDGGSPDGIRWRGLRREDPAGYEIARLISEIILDTSSDGLNDDALRLQEDVGHGILRISWNRGFVPDNAPLLIMTQGPYRPSGQKYELLWPSWIDSTGVFVPLGGNWLRVPERRFAIALAVLMNVEAAVEGLLHRASPRNRRSTQPSLGAHNAWEVPDLRDERCGALLVELEKAFDSYRHACSQLSRKEALADATWRNLIETGEALWRI